MKLGLAFLGPHRLEAERIQRFCVDQGMSWKRAYAIACMASIGQFCWAFENSIADFCGISKATVKRAVRQAKKYGVLVSRWLRRGEQPKGSDRPITCGGAMRRFTAWGVSVRDMAARCARHAIRWIWHEEQKQEQRKRARAELDAALTDLRGPPT